MPAATLTRLGGPENQPTHNSVTRQLDTIFADKAVPAQDVNLFGLWWVRKSGIVCVKNVVVPPHDAEADILDWHGVRLACLRPAMEGGATRVEARHRGALIGAWVYGMDTVYNLVDPHGGEQMRRTDNPQHYAMMSFVLAHVTEFQPGQAGAGVIPLPMQRMIIPGEQAA